METKICKTCRKEKQLDKFYFRKDANKYKNECKECTKTRARNFYYDRNIREKLKFSIEKEKNKHPNQKKMYKM